MSNLKQTLQQEAIEKFDKWWTDRMGTEYLGTFPNIELKDLLATEVSNAVDRTVEEIKSELEDCPIVTEDSGVIGYEEHAIKHLLDSLTNKKGEV